MRLAHRKREFVQPEAAPPTPTYPPMIYPPPAPPPTARTDQGIFLLGLALGYGIAVGLFLIHAALLIPPPVGPSDPGVQAYGATVRALGWASAAVLDGAVGTSIFAAWWATFTRRELPDAARRYPFIFATVFLALWVFISFLFYGVFPLL